MLRDEAKMRAEIDRRAAKLRANSVPPAQIDVWPSDRTLSEISLACGCISLIGVGAPVLTDSKLAMWAFIAIGCAGLAAVTVLRIIRYLRMRQRRPPVSILLKTWLVTLASLIVVAMALLISPYIHTKSLFDWTSASQADRKSLFDLFKSDFSNLSQLSVETTATVGGPSNTSTFYTKVYLDFSAKTWFGAFFLPKNKDSYLIAADLANTYLRLLEDAKQKVYMAFKDPGDSERIEIAELTFSGRIYLYHEDDLSLKQMSDLTELFKTKGAALQLRGKPYQISRAMQSQH